MAKDPAFLFYPGDCLQDIQFLNDAQAGVYMRIICSHMKNICLTQPRLNQFTINLTEPEKSGIVEILTEVKGGYCVEWVVDSIGKRKKYSESRRKNRQGNICKSYVPHMENENENVIIDVNTKENRVEIFINKVKEFSILDLQEQKKFIDYWTECGENAKKCRWEKEKVFDIKKRMERWNNNKKTNGQQNTDSFRETHEALGGGKLS